MSQTQRQGQVIRPLKAGFSLVELLMAVMVLVLSAIGGSTLFSQTIRQFNRSSITLQEQEAINADLARVLEINDRYRCSTGTCRFDPTENPASTPPPDQDHYAPEDPDATVENGDGTTEPSFRQRCQLGLLDGLIPSAIGPAELTGTSIQRSARLDPANANPSGHSLPPHRYLVEWRNAQNELLRQVQLIPTVAAWCP